MVYDDSRVVYIYQLVSVITPCSPTLKSLSMGRLRCHQLNKETERYKKRSIICDALTIIYGLDPMKAWSPFRSWKQEFHLKNNKEFVTFFLFAGFNYSHLTPCWKSSFLRLNLGLIIRS